LLVLRAARRGTVFDAAYMRFMLHCVKAFLCAAQKIFRQQGPDAAERAKFPFFKPCTFC
jgi:hypothetical protein